jgi:CPA2 family monovalent cation:H+ antiporter-2
VSSEVAIFAQLVTVFAVASVAVLVANFLRFPSVVGFLVAGVLLGPQGFKLVPELAALHALNETAIVLLMFTIGLEFSVSSITHLRKAFFGLGVLQVFLTALVIGLLLRYAFGLNGNASAVAGYMIALSSTAIIMKVLQTNHEVASPHGNAALGVLLFQDIVAIPMMLSLPLLAGQPNSRLFQTPSSLLSLVFEIAAAVVVIGLAARYVVPRLMKIVVDSRSRELFFFCVLFVCFGVALLAETAGFSLPLGAFVAGVVIAGSPFGRQASSEVVPLRDNLLGFFFISLGMMLDLKFFALNIHGVLALAVLLLLVKIAITYLSGIVVQYTEKVAIVVALLLFQVGEFGFVIAKEALKLKILSVDQFQYFLSISLLSMIVSPIVFKAAPSIAIRIGGFNRDSVKTIRNNGSSSDVMESFASGVSLRGHAVIIGFGLAGQEAAQRLEEAGRSYCIVDLNFRAIKSLQSRGVPAIYGDASKDEILEAAGIDRARVILVAVAGRHMIPAILSALERNHFKGRIVVRAVYQREADEIMQIQHGVEVVIAEVESAHVFAARAIEAFT